MADTESIHRTTDTAIEVLDYVRRSNGATFSEILDHFDLGRSTVYTHLNTLKNQGFIVQENGQSVVGLRLREFSVSARNRKPSYQIVRKKMDELVDETDNEIEFLVEEAGRVNIVYHSEGVRHDRVRLHPHNTAAGKSILSELPRDRVEEILDERGLPQATPNTITDRGVLFEELETVQERGWAYNDSECFSGYHGVGTAIEGIDGSILGALTIGGPVYRVDEDTLKNEMVDLLRGAVTDLEEAIESKRDTITTELTNR
jgi:DNA-binding IclR family transcriptional regulator